MQAGDRAQAKGDTLQVKGDTLQAKGDTLQAEEDTFRERETIFGDGKCPSKQKEVLLRYRKVPFRHRETYRRAEANAPQAKRGEVCWIQPLEAVKLHAIMPKPVCQSTVFRLHWSHIVGSSVYHSWIPAQFVANSNKCRYSNEAH